MVSQLKLVCCITTITTSLYLLLYLTMPLESGRSSPGPGDRILTNFKEKTVKDEGEIVTTTEISITRNLSVLVRPDRRTVVVEPRWDYCQEGNTTRTLVIAVFSAPGNSLARAVVRKTWAVQMREYPGVEVVFFLGQDQDQDVQVTLGGKRENMINLKFSFLTCSLLKLQT